MSAKPEITYFTPRTEGPDGPWLRLEASICDDPAPGPFQSAPSRQQQVVADAVGPAHPPGLGIRKIFGHLEADYT